MIPWREKFLAFGVHFLLTAVVALAAAALIFLVWFPEPFNAMIGGTRLFELVVGCDLALGPLLSLVIYDSRKPRGKLLVDYAVVGILQLGALVYGVSVMAGSRPAYVVFVGDRLEVVMAAELEDADLAAARDPGYRARPWWGPELVATVVPPEDRETVLFSGLAGKDVQLMPRYYVDYDSQRERVLKRAAAVSSLRSSHAAAGAVLDPAIAALHVPEETLRWLPVRYRRGFWVTLIAASSGRPVDYLPIDPN